MIEPGIYPDMPDADYFGAGSLDGPYSHSDCKVILDRTPAAFKWWKENPTDDHRPEFDIGHVTHELILGKGAGYDVHDFNAWNEKGARAARAESYERGRTPIKRSDFDECKAMADAVRLHPVARKLLDNMDHAELAMFWDDDGLSRRAKLDGITGKFIFDVKTTVSADAEDFGRSAGKFCYHSAAAYYIDAVRALLDIADPTFLFVVVEKSPPNLVNVIQLDPYDLELGVKRNRRALDLFRQCRESGNWPGYGDGINQAALPRWAEIAEEAA